MRAEEFLEKARQEHRNLRQSCGKDDWSGVDAYRLLVLEARLRQAGETILSPEEVEGLLSECALPDPSDLLDRLEADLVSDDDPRGLLLAALLSIDGRTGTGALAGQEMEHFVKIAVAMVSLFPERVLCLGEYATMRLETLTGEAAISPLWREVEGAPIRWLETRINRPSDE